MLDYPKLEEYKKGGRVKIINKSIIKKKKMKQKQTQKQIVNVYTNAPKRTYRRQVKKVEPQQQRVLTLAPFRTELPSYIYSQPQTILQQRNSTLPIFSPYVSTSLPTFAPTVSTSLPTFSPYVSMPSSPISLKLENIVKKNYDDLTNEEKKALEEFNNIPSFSQIENYEGDEYADIGKRGTWEGLTTDDIKKILTLENPEKLPTLSYPVVSPTLPPMIPPPMIPPPPPMIPPPPPMISTTLPSFAPIVSPTLPSFAPTISTSLPTDFLKSIKGGTKLKPTKKEELKEESKKSSSSNPILDAIKTGIKLKPKEEQLPIKPKEEAKKVSSNPMLDIIKAGLSGRRSVIKDDEEDWNDEPAIQEFKTPTKGDLNQLINRIGASGLKPTVKEGSNPYESGYKNYYIYALVNKHGYSINSVINLTQTKLAELLKAKG